MTKISEPFSVMTVSNDVTTFGDMCVQPGPTATSVIVTHDSMSASLIEIDDDRAVKVRTWHTKLTSPFTCPVVYDPTKEQYIAVYRRTISFISPEETSSVKRKSVQLACAPYRVLSRPHDEPLVVFQDGSLFTLTAACNGACSSVDASEQVVHVELNTTDKATFVLTVTDAGSEHKCKLVRADSADVSIVFSVSLTTLLCSSKMLSCCLSNGKPLILLSDGTLAVVTENGHSEIGKLSEDILPSARTKIFALDAQRILVVSQDRLVIWALPLQTCEASQLVKVRQAALIGNLVFLLRPDLLLSCVLLSVGPTQLSRLVGLGAARSNETASDSLDAPGTRKEMCLDMGKAALEPSEDQLVLTVRNLLCNKLDESAMNAALNTPYSADRLLHSLQHGISLDEAKALIGYLLSFLESYSLGDSVPMQKALDWLCCIIDAHLPRLLLSNKEEVGHLLDRACRVVEGVQKLFVDLDHVEQWLLSQRLGQLKFDSSALYTIEIMEI
uniref:Putative nucleolar protein 11 n=1 Tax=Ornithodoros turicata TaxID=34597 RepID=A0A2R5LMQ0_9ACAR